MQQFASDHRVVLDVLSKTARVTPFFWIMKVLATTLGETAGDFVSMTLDLGYYAGLTITFAALVVILALQVGTRHFHPLLFWAAIVATTTVGTEISDSMDRSLGLGYIAGSVILVIGLLLSLSIWYLRERDLRVYPIVRREVEILFWVTVLFSNSLGTAFGDFLTDNMGLTFVQGALMTARPGVALLHAPERRAAFLGCFHLHATIRSNLWRLSHQARRAERVGHAERLGIPHYLSAATRGTCSIQAD